MSDRKRRRGTGKEKDDPQAKPKGAHAQYHCDYCRRDITYVMRIRCAQCEDFDLCVECFSVGAEVQPHSNTHPYRVIDSLHFPLLTADWTANEELLLLEGIETFGFGNWGDVAAFVGTKDAAACNNHYHEAYLNSATKPFPDVETAAANLSLATLRERNEAAELQAYTNPPSILESVEEPEQKKTKTKGRPPNVIKSDPMRRLDTESKPGPAEAAGYMPLRIDFETEYENESELVLADMQWVNDEDPSHRESKLQLLQAYCKVLDRRDQLRNFVFSRDLISSRNALTIPDRTRTKEEKEIAAKFRPFFRFQSAEAHAQFVESILTEQKFASRIEQLQRWRRMGATTLQEGEQLEEHKKRRAFEEEAEMQQSRWMKEGSQLGEIAPLPGSAKALQQQRDRFSRVSNRDRGLELQRLSLDKMRLANRKGSGPVIAGKPGYQVLSMKERDLCGTLKMLPQQYLIIKEGALREATRLRVFSKTALASLFPQIDPAKLSRIFDFFATAGWVSTSGEHIPVVGELPPPPAPSLILPSPAALASEPSAAGLLNPVGSSTPQASPGMGSPAPRPSSAVLPIAPSVGPVVPVSLPATSAGASSVAPSQLAGFPAASNPQVRLILPK